MYDSKTVSYEIETQEYGFNTNCPSIAPTSMAMNIPALMPYIKQAPPATGKFTVNKNMLINDNACKPSPTQVITTQNYITVTRWANDQPYFPQKNDGKGRCVRYSRFVVDILNGDIRNIHISRNV